jgi:TPR repeat protein
MFALGGLHGGGHGLPMDRATAQRWFRAAAQPGYGQAQLMLGRYPEAVLRASRTRWKRASGWSALNLDQETISTHKYRVSRVRHRINAQHLPEHDYDHWNP